MILTDRRILHCTAVSVIVNLFKQISFFFAHFSSSLIFFELVGPLQAFAKMFGQQPDDLDMHVVYDVSHNIAKEEQHEVDGQMKRLLVHRKGAFWGGGGGGHVHILVVYMGGSAYTGPQ